MPQKLSDYIIKKIYRFIAAGAEFFFKKLKITRYV